MVMNSKSYYNAIAKNYSKLARKRLKYLMAVEAIITKSQNIDSYLDIGCGDGKRSLRIIDQLKPRKVVLLDESDQMLQNINASQLGVIEVKVGNYLSQPIETKFDLITCLWNVFGHLESKEIKLLFLEKIHNSLTESGILFLDINNRYNLKSYGIKAVFQNIFKDFTGKQNAGYYSLNAGTDISSQVYIHNPFEMDKLLKRAGFSKVKKYYIDYDTGEEKSTFLEGQILYRADY
ncbi:hypothetical protein BTO09_10745 [Gilvibacter sp. SZ-19]|nr:hypothetical protein BTO09_10745 [Gilvibacter sp. SZ-19]